METKHAVLIRSPTGKQIPGEVRILHWDRRARLLRAAKFLGACWAASAVSVILPIAHFFLVPGFFLGGILAAWVVSGQKSVVLGGKSTCPECGAQLPIARSADRWPLTDLCSSCRRAVTVEKR